MVLWVKTDLLLQLALNAEERRQPVAQLLLLGGTLPRELPRRLHRTSADGLRKCIVLGQAAAGFRPPFLLAWPTDCS